MGETVVGLAQHYQLRVSRIACIGGGSQRYMYLYWTGPSRAMGRKLLIIN